VLLVLFPGLVFLQSSINIEEGLGAAGLSAIYATSSFSSLFVTPFLIDVKGAKMAIVLGEMGILLYTLANFFPSNCRRHLHSVGFETR